MRGEREREQADYKSDAKFGILITFVFGGRGSCVFVELLEKLLLPPS